MRSEVTLIPVNLVEELPKKPITSQMRAANGTIIEVVGLVSFPVLLQVREFLNNGVTSDHICEL